MSDLASTLYSIQEAKDKKSKKLDLSKQNLSDLPDELILNCLESVIRLNRSERTPQNCLDYVGKVGIIKSYDIYNSA